MPYSSFQDYRLRPLGHPSGSHGQSLLAARRLILATHCWPRKTHVSVGWAERVSEMEKPRTKLTKDTKKDGIQKIRSAVFVVNEVH